jgi:hypothetical protein
MSAGICLDFPIIVPYSFDSPGKRPTYHIAAQSAEYLSPVCSPGLTPFRSSAAQIQ